MIKRRGSSAIAKQLVNEMLICPSDYAVLNHNVILYTKTEIIFSLFCEVVSVNGNDLQICNEDEEAEMYLNFTSQDVKRVDSEINDFGESDQAENKNDEYKRRIRKFFWNCK